MVMPDYPVLIDNGDVIDVSTHAAKIGIRIPTYISNELCTRLMDIPISARVGEINLRPEQETVVITEAANISNTIIADMLFGVASALVAAAQDQERRNDVVMQVMFCPEYLTDPMYVMCAGGPWGHGGAPILVVALEAERELLPSN